MVLVDAILFFNEHELTENRLNRLVDQVGCFLVIELGLTHAGIPRGFEFPTIMRKLPKKVLKKIRYVPVSVGELLNDLQEDIESVRIIDRWKIENLHRSYIDREAAKIDKWTHIIISDADEVPSFAAISYVKNFSVKSPLTLRQRMFHYSLDFVDESAWLGSVISPRFHFARRGAQWMRNRRAHFSQFSPGGWHFTSFGGVQRVKIKARNLAHAELEEISKNEGELMTRVTNGINLYDEPPYVSSITKNLVIDDELFEFTNINERLIEQNFFGMCFENLTIKRIGSAEITRASWWNQVRVIFWCSYRKLPHRFSGL